MDGALSADSLDEEGGGGDGGTTTTGAVPRGSETDGGASAAPRRLAVGGGARRPLPPQPGGCEDRWPSGDGDAEIECNDWPVDPVPCMHPSEAAVRGLLGAPDPRTQCWGCMHGVVGDASVSEKRVSEIYQIVRRNIGQAEMHAIAQEIHEYHERYIRTPTNGALAPNERPVPEWRAATVYAHFTEHIQEPAIALVERLKKITRLRLALEHNQLYRRPPDAPDDAPVTAHVESAKLYIKVMEMEMRLYQMKPPKMFLYSKDTTLVPDSTGGGRPMLNPNKFTFSTGTGTRDYLGGG